MNDQQTQSHSECDLTNTGHEVCDFCCLLKNMTIVVIMLN